MIERSCPQEERSGVVAQQLSANFERLQGQVVLFVFRSNHRQIAIGVRQVGVQLHCSQEFRLGLSPLLLMHQRQSILVSQWRVVAAPPDQEFINRNRIGFTMESAQQFRLFK